MIRPHFRPTNSTSGCTVIKCSHYCRGKWFAINKSRRCALAFFVFNIHASISMAQCYTASAHIQLRAADIHFNAQSPVCKHPDTHYINGYIRFQPSVAHDFDVPGRPNMNTILQAIRERMRYIGVQYVCKKYIFGKKAPTYPATVQITHATRIRRAVLFCDNISRQH